MSSRFDGLLIRPKVFKNPRRAGSRGHRSMGIVLDAGDEGITYEDYIARGRRRQDLDWDWRYGHVELILPPPPPEG